MNETINLGLTDFYFYRTVCKQKKIKKREIWL